MHCPHCNQALTSDAFRFCPHCGGSLVGAAAPDAGNPGGARVSGNVKTDGGDFVGRDQIIYADPAEAARAKARVRYLTNLRQRCNVLPLTALGDEAGTGDKVTLDQVYVSLDTRTTVPLTEAEKKENQRYRYRNERPLQALEAATAHRRLALLGDPGGGKSTFVRQVAAHAASVCLGQAEPFPDWSPALVPLVVVLRELGPALAALALDGLSRADQDRRLIAAVRRRWEVVLDEHDGGAWAPALDDLLSAGEVLLVFDGLDEVAADCRPRVRAAVRALLRAYPEIRRVIITSRIRSYTGEAVLTGFEQATLAPFDEAKIRAFVAGWYEAQDALERLTPAEAKARALDLQAAALKPALLELAANPMLLTTMALIHQREVGLPEQRVRLYEEAVKVLLQRWQRQKGVVVSPALEAVLGDDRQLRKVLERVAYEAHRQQAGDDGAADVRRGDLLVLLDAPVYLDGVGLVDEFLTYVDQRAGLLVGRGGGEGRRPQTYTFPHRTFQEYLAGCYMVSQRSVHRVYRDHAREGDAWYLAAQLGAEELLYNRHSEVPLLDLAYALSPEREPAGTADWRAVLWSAQMAALLGRARIEQDVEDGGAAYLARLVPRLVQVLQQASLPAVERVEAGKALAKLGDPRPGVGLREDGLPDILWCPVDAGPFVMGSTDEDTLAYPDEKPQHTYEIQEPYLIGRYPVTNAQYAAFVRAGGYRTRRYWTGAGWAWRERENVVGPEVYGEPFTLPNHPVVGVSWYEATAFCAWLAEALNVAGARLNVWQNGEIREINLEPSTFNLQLPSEPQWERAARGVDGRRYPWGDEIDVECVNYRETGIGATNAVGAFPGGASPCGIEETSGNVWEWCCTKWQSDYTVYRSEDDVRGDDRRVLRGGPFSYSGGRVRCAYRDYNAPYYRDRSYGFRVAASPYL